VQYGEGVRARATYLQKYQLLPYARASEAMRDLFGCGISPAALKTVGQRCSYKLINTELRIKGELKRADVIGADETGVRVGGNNHWIHVTRTEKLTHYGYDTRRGKAAMEAINILPGYKGTLVRDGWYSYDQYLQCEHSLCNAHLLRELIYVGEVDERQKQWTEPMIKLLMEIKEEAERVRDDRQQQIMLQWQEKFVRGYEMLIASAIRINPPPGDKQAEEVPTRCEEALRLIKRLEQRRGQVLRFMTDLRVPFDNNGSERDLRMLKLQQKIAGCFRTPEGAEGFCRIRSYLSTARKQGHSLLSALERVFKGKPLILAPSTSE
jgi:transposase